MEELIIKFKDQAIQNMVDKNILASIQLAYIISNKDVGIEPETLINEICNREDLKGVTDYKEACRIFASSNKEKNKFINIIETNKLTQYDRQALDKKDKVVGTDIEIDVDDTTPFIEVYTIKSKEGASIYTTNDLDEAKLFCEEDQTVVDSKGRVVYKKESENEEEDIKGEIIHDEPEPTKPKCKPALVNGVSIYLDGIPLYKNQYSKEVSTFFNGRVRIIKDKSVNNRIQVADNGTNKIYFLDVNDIK